MVKTGISIPEVFSVMAILLPVIPILIIFIRRTWQQDIMIFLGAICLLSFLQHLMIFILGLIPANSNSINSVFGLGEFAVLLYLFKMIVTTGWLKEIMNTVLIAFLSVAITTYALRGTETHSLALASTAAFILLVAAVIALLQLIRDKQLFIFQSPVFWIAGGNICYFSMFILTGFVGAQGKGTPALQQEKIILLSVINAIRFIFLIVAANMARNEKEQANY